MKQDKTTDELELAWRLVYDSRRKVKLSKQNLCNLLKLITSIEIIDNRTNEVLVPTSNIYAKDYLDMLENTIEDYKKESIIIPIITDKGLSINLTIKYPELTKEEETIYNDNPEKYSDITLTKTEQNILEGILRKYRRLSYTQGD